MLTGIQYRILKRISPGEPTTMSGSAYAHKSKLKTLLGENILDEVKGKVVIDFGCGEGAESIEFAQNGAKKVIGLDMRESVLETARKHAAQAGVDALCRFVTSTDEKADIIVSIDAFEHFDDPAAILSIMDGLLATDGKILASFGPTWFHPYGGHLFSVFPWAHLLFTEKALIRWRSDIRSDGATRFREVEGGLNGMSLRRFKRLVKNSPFTVAALEAVPIRKLAPVHNALTAEFTTSIVRCTLKRKGD